MHTLDYSLSLYPNAQKRLIDTMDFETYQQSVENMPLYDDLIYGLVTEVGEVADLIKKDNRPEPIRKLFSVDDLELEIGDVLWYLTMLASEYGIDMSVVAKRNIEKLEARHASNGM